VGAAVKWIDEPTSWLDFLAIGGSLVLMIAWFLVLRHLMA